MKPQSFDRPGSLGVAEFRDRERSVADALRRCIQRADHRGSEQFIALREPIGACRFLDVFARAQGGERFFWEHPAEEFALVALGCVHALAIEPARRFASSSALSRALFEATHVVGAETGHDRVGPLLLGGFAFSAEHAPQGEWEAFPGARLLLPEMLLVRDRGRVWQTVCHGVSPGSDFNCEWSVLRARMARAQVLSRPQVTAEAGEFDLAGAGADFRIRVDRAHRVYREQIEAALSSIAQGHLEKVVLARSLQIDSSQAFDLRLILQRLRNTYPECVTLAYGVGGDCFVSASPERLIDQRGDRVRTGALAGTAPRGRTVREDELLGLRLRHNRKEQAEHRAVLGAIRAALDDVCGPLQGPASPALLRIAGIQHLHTPLSGQLRRDLAEVEPGALPTVLDLVARLHPTPAVGGLPGKAALDWIETSENLQRGWYGGPVGFVDRSGGGEFWVALRSGLIRNQQAVQRSEKRAMARLFAGAGVVRGSYPEKELRETRLKMRALLAPLVEM